MVHKNEVLRLEKIVGGGQAIGTLKNGKKAFVWGGLPGELVEVSITKQKSKLVEGVVANVFEPSKKRIDPHDPDSYLSTSPWQIMTFDEELRLKAELVEEAFELHDVALPGSLSVYSDDNQFGYRNKVEYSWWGDKDEKGNETLDLAFFKRGSKGKIPIDETSLAKKAISECARTIRDFLREHKISARQLKTLLIRCNQAGNCVWQLYVKDASADWIKVFSDFTNTYQGGEIIYSDPRSPASRITKRIASYGNVTLSDTVLGFPFRYATEGFFQVNLPVYEKALRDMGQWLPEDNKVIDLYSGVGTIGLTIGGNNCTLIETDENAVREMQINISNMKSSARAIHARTEESLEYINADEIVIVDPPRAGLHQKVIEHFLQTAPSRIIYLSCNPVTQARDVALLLTRYKIVHHQGYDFFPRTPHIEHLVILDKTK